ncbi:lantibiotic dehydratase [Streptomyces flaveolus]|uniref:lantibiotic dehydratase n=1 Tax=Streptomyces flaveolus TaxID=67297 RepID=UPI003425BD51
MREAVLVSSPSLAARLQMIEAGQDVSDKDSKKAARALTRYQLRMATRSTPFGLMAGVAVGTFGDDPSAVLGEHHRKRAEPDRKWLRAALHRHAQETGLRARGHVRLLVNNTCFVQAGRVVVPVMRPPSESAGEPDKEATRRTVRRTAVVETVLVEAARPVTAAELHSRLLARFPGADEERVWGLLDKLVECEVLLTDSLPPLSEKHLLPYVLNRDPSWSVGTAYQDLFETYETRPVGQGYEELSVLHDRTGSSESLHVDLAMDAHVRLPRIVAREAERAASVLWRLTPPDSEPERALRAYHAEFLERYSQGELVPVTRLLDPDAGLGAPAGYLWPPSHRGDSPPPAPEGGERDELLSQLVMEAAASGQRHIDLSDELIARLATGERRPPRSADLFVSVSAGSLHAVEEGDFSLVVSPIAGTSQAGAAWGRFAHLLDAVDTLKDITGARDPGTDQPLPVQLVYAPYDDRGANVAAAPRLTDHYLAVGVFDEVDEPGRIRLDDVLVSADFHGFHLYDGASGREIEPFVPHLLHGKLGPNVARFLREAPTMGGQGFSWNWGSVEGSAFLPGVRHGRALLSQPRWRLRRGDVPHDVGWEDALAGWRKRWNVPDRVRLAQRDLYVSLDLRTPSHREMLRQEVATKTCTLYEDPAPDPETGWLLGPDGVHEAEIVVPLHATATARGDARARRDAQKPSRRPTRRRSDELAQHHLPGGEWLSAHLYCSPKAQQDILRHRLEPWIQSLGQSTDKWFFIRYADPGTGRPHIRLRVHGDPTALSGGVLGSFHDWSRGLAAGRLVSDVSLHTYRAETERYGGPSAIAAAEDFFCADSRLALDRLRHGVNEPVDVAADIVTLARVFLAGTAENWEDVFLREVEKNEDLHQVFVRSRRATMDRVAVDSPLGGSTQREHVWCARLADYAATVRRETPPGTWPGPSDVLWSIAHMHSNRRLGPDRKAELTVRALARGVVEAHVNRRRSGDTCDGREGAGR